MDENDVALVDDAGHTIGTSSKMAVHTQQTELHRGFSVHLFDQHGRLLLTRRALSKRSWPGVWTNSCCGHPRPGEEDRLAVVRRAKEELGLDVKNIDVLLSDYRYCAVDANGIMENELCPVFRGDVDCDQLNPDPHEVVETAWVDPQSVLTSSPLFEHILSPWAAEQFQLLSGSGFQQEAFSFGRQLESCDMYLEHVENRLSGAIYSLSRTWEDLSGMAADTSLVPEDFPSWMMRIGLRGGKRFRPMMAYWGMLSVPSTDRLERARIDVITIGAAIEMLHAFAMIHDDVMDDAALRRGAPPAHVEAADSHRRNNAKGDEAEFGKNMAILLGDLALSEASNMALDLPKQLRSIWSTLVTELMLGQSLDLVGSARRSWKSDEAQEVSRLKSGCYTVWRPLQLGAVAAGATPSALQALESYGKHAGEAFQLRDDILGVWGDPQDTGKPRGDDLCSGKATLLLSIASQHLGGDDMTLLQQAHDGKLSTTDAEKLSSIMDKAGVRDSAESHIQSSVDAALLSLESSTLSSDGRSGLEGMAARIAWREA